jgi:hypothetical protein
MITLIREGWGQENPAFRQLWTSRFVPDSTLEQQRWYNELQRVTTSPANAARLSLTSRDVDVSPLLPEIHVPTLVLHARGDAAVEFNHGREIAMGIPGARFVPLESRNHLLLGDEPAFQVFLQEVRRFLGTARPEAQDSMPGTPRRSLAEPSVAPGMRLGHYEVVSRLGAGGMGIVYEARDTKLRRSVAIKVLAQATAGSDDGHRRLLREARHAAALNHPNICTIHEVAQANGVDFLVMELVKGRTLNVLTGPAGLSAGAIRSYGIQIADAVAYAHTQGIIHGDLKGANVMVRGDGRLKVLDFGIARRIALEPSVFITTGPDSAIAGTPAYMAPEVLQGQAPDVRSDVWSIGVMLFEMATGHLPFRGGALDVVAAIARDEPQFQATGVSASLKRVIRRCLAKDPASRYPSAAELSADLAGMADARDWPILGGMFDR